VKGMAQCVSYYTALALKFYQMHVIQLLLYFRELESKIKRKSGGKELVKISYRRAVSR
jgi:hypothetical protein